MSYIGLLNTISFRLVVLQQQVQQQKQKCWKDVIDAKN